MKICQSCGMPIHDDSVLGTNKDGSINRDYCKYCYEKGEFIDKVSMEEYIDMCSKYGEQAGMTNEEMREHVTKLFPTLKRWKMATFDDFLKLDIRVGEIIEISKNEKAKKPAYKMRINFGDEIGIKNSSAQITDLYNINDLTNKKVLAVVNFPPRQVADFISEVLVLGIYTDNGVSLIVPDKEAKIGDKLG